MLERALSTTLTHATPPHLHPANHHYNHRIQALYTLPQHNTLTAFLSFNICFFCRKITHCCVVSLSFSLIIQSCSRVNTADTLCFTLCFREVIVFFFQMKKTLGKSNDILGLLISEQQVNICRAIVSKPNVDPSKNQPRWNSLLFFIHCIRITVGLLVSVMKGLYSLFLSLSSARIPEALCERVVVNLQLRYL